MIEIIAIVLLWIVFLRAIIDKICSLFCISFWIIEIKDPSFAIILIWNVIQKMHFRYKNKVLKLH